MRKMLILLLTLSILLSGCADFGFAHVDGNAAVIDKTAGDAVENLVYFEDSDVAFPAHTREYAMCLGGNYYLVFKAPYSYAVVDDNSEIYCTDNIFCGFGVTNNHIWVLENQPDNGHNVFILTKISPHPDVKIETFQITEFDGGKSLPTISCSRDYVIVNVDNETIYLFMGIGFNQPTTKYA